jgi:hypothetical protein
MRVIITAAIALFLATSARATEPQYLVLGNGAQSCGTWIEDRRTNNDIWRDDRTWILGYITGINYALAITGKKNGVLGRNDDPTALVAWMDNYCATHPLDTIARAAVVLVDQLIIRR